MSHPQPTPPTPSNSFSSRNPFPLIAILSRQKGRRCTLALNLQRPHATMPSASPLGLPDVSSPELVLTQPTDAESLRTWVASHPEWGAALSLDGYLERERFVLTTPLGSSKPIAHTQWILTDRSALPGSRPVLSTCETLRKRAIVVDRQGVAKEGWAHGVGSVFTYPEFRGRGYAGRMMAMLGDAINRDQGDLFSVLFSDIGKDFYARWGWKPAVNTHLELPAKTLPDGAHATLHRITASDLPALAARDEELIRNRLRATRPSSLTAVILPDLEQLVWHMRREDFMCNHLFSRTPDVRGAMYTASEGQSMRVWAVWSRAYYAKKEVPEKNALQILRFVVEDDTIAEDDLANAVLGILGTAQKEALDWCCGKVIMWNPIRRVRDVAESLPSLRAKFVVRESDNISSINMFGDDPTGDVDWLFNEKFGWC